MLTLMKRKKSIQMEMLWFFGLSLLIAFVFMLIFASFINRYGYYLYVPYFNLMVYIVIFILSFFMLTKRVVKDLVTLEEGLQLISEGNLQHRVSIYREDELGRVALGINLMTQKLEQQIQKERDLEKSKIDLITGVSHDLRTPLTSIIGYLDLLRNNSFRDQNEYERFVENTYNKAIHLKKLIDDLFEFTRLTTSNIQLSLKLLDVHQLLDQMLFEFEPFAQENGIRIIKKIGDSPVNTLIDSGKFARAIDNLLMNALKYSVKPGSICILLKSDEQRLYIEIENQGHPLTHEQERRLFDRFYKVDHSRSSEGIQAGSGLGLSIARNIIELHGGTIKLIHTNGIYIFTIAVPFRNSLDSSL
ncbi:HAMP domain-containing sensor histidine kinase [Paenibacillus sp. PFR10]|uniref:histidine kinase n=2 Tax=Paenibacillus TaxID=44249 RepID=A0ABU3RKX0_9BACL|nr:HAMP domain-containing sensor histidine kinase [Paenibacillus sp. PFR10]MDU0204847.1 HAMP domain-containing sensor histidine kinase [Paenibacillus sp. PFR10]